MCLPRCGPKRVCAAGTCFEYDWPSSVTADERETGAALIRSEGSLQGCLPRPLQFAIDSGLSFSWAIVLSLRVQANIPTGWFRRSAPLLTAERRNVRRVSVSGISWMFVTRRCARRDRSFQRGRTRQYRISGKRAHSRDIATALYCSTAGACRVGYFLTVPVEPPRITAETKRLNEEVDFSNGQLSDGLAHAYEYWSGRSEVDAKFSCPRC